LNYTTGDLPDKLVRNEYRSKFDTKDLIAVIKLGVENGHANVDELNKTLSETFQEHELIMNDEITMKNLIKKKRKRTNKEQEQKKREEKERKKIKIFVFTPSRRN